MVGTKKKTDCIHVAVCGLCGANFCRANCGHYDTEAVKQAYSNALNELASLVTRYDNRNDNGSFITYIGSRIETIRQLAGVV